MSEQVMFLGKVNKRINKTSSVQGYESSWLGRWTQLSNDEVKLHGSSNGESKELTSPEINHVRESSQEGTKVLPFPMFKASQKRDSTKKLQAFDENVGSSSKATANSCLDFRVQEKTTHNLIELIGPKPVRLYATVDSVRRVPGELNLPEEDGHKLMKGSATVSMKLKGKIFGGYLDLFPTNLDQCHRRRGVRLQSLESSKDTREDDGPRGNESSAETDILEMDRLEPIHLTTGRKGDSSIHRTEIPDMNEEPPLVLDRENSVDGHQGETSNSATQSMKVDNFLSREHKRVREPEPEPEHNSRWVKRLKTNVSDSSSYDETKSLMKLEETSTKQKGNNNLFLEILKSGINNLQPRNQEPVVTSQIKNINHGRGEDITLLHPWIQRWCKKKTTSEDQQEVSSEQENQKEFEKKQYPSIAAMALMGKALSGLNPYGLRKTDSLMVWNARDLS